MRTFKVPAHVKKMSNIRRREGQRHRGSREHSSGRREEPNRESGVQEEQSSPSLYADVFLEYKTELDVRHDRHERLVKLSRDTTIHSKRAIFLLHRAALLERGTVEREERLDEAKGKLQEVGQFLQSTARELHGLDPWLHLSAFSPGLQEFVEALAYYVFLRQSQLVCQEEVCDWLQFSCEKEDGGGGGGEEVVCVPLSQLNYVLGIADLTGELMRMCITAVGAGQQEVPFQILPFISSISHGFQSLLPISKEVGHKLRTLRSSVAKIETACYTLQIRGSEIPRHMLGDVFCSTASQESDQLN